jgi:predicted nucleic acid-binding protein
MAEILTLPEVAKFHKTSRDTIKFIDCAVEAQADYIISGDAHLLNIKAYRGIPIYSPRNFSDLLGTIKI